MRRFFEKETKPFFLSKRSGIHVNQAYPGILGGCFSLKAAQFSGRSVSEEGVVCDNAFLEKDKGY